MNELHTRVMSQGLVYSLRGPTTSKTRSLGFHIVKSSPYSMNIRASIVAHITVPCSYVGVVSHASKMPPNGIGNYLRICILPEALE